MFVILLFQAFVAQGQTLFPVFGDSVRLGYPNQRPSL
jgi:hypothetical protein